MQRELTTQRLWLRPPRPGDERAVFNGWMRDGEVLRWLAMQPHRELSQTKAMLAWDEARWLKRSAWTWLLVPHGGVPVGLVQWLPQASEGEPHHLRLGYVLSRALWGQGLMQEAVAAVIAEAFRQPSVWRLDALCDVENRPSLRLLEGAGFHREGVLRRHSVHPNAGPTPRDVVLLARVRA